MNWTESAKRWLPSRVVPLRVRLYTETGIAYDAYYGLSALEGMLQFTVVEMESGESPTDAMEALGAFYDIPIPIADEVVHGFPVARCSHAQWHGMAFEDVRPRRKRTEVEAIGRDKVLTKGGPFKDLDIRAPIRTSPWVDFFVVGDPDKLTALLSRCNGIGRDYARGLGRVSRFSIDDADDRALVWERKPQRSIPVQSEHEASLLFDPSAHSVRFVTTRAPYWNKRSKTLCAVPV